MAPAKKPRKKAKKEIRKKKPTRQRVKKKRYGGGISIRSSTPDRDKDINRTAYVHESKRAGRAWKVQPKDSLEVYRERRHRKEDRREDNTEPEGKESHTLQPCRCYARNKRCTSSCSTFVDTLVSESNSSISSEDFEQ